MMGYRTLSQAGNGRAARDPEQRALSRARWSITARIAAVMVAVLLLVGGVVYFVMLAAQHTNMNRELAYAANRSSLASPPGCAWLAIQAPGQPVATSPGMPAGFPLRAAMTGVAAGQPASQREVVANNTSYQVLTTRRGAEVVQAVYDMRFDLADQRNLLLAIGVAELVGVVGAAVAGGLLARRSMAPLTEALRRQRRFVADASHELRTPVTRLHTRAQLLLRHADSLDLPDRVGADLRRLVSGSRQLGEVIDDLLVSTRLAAGVADWPGECVAVDLAALAEDVCADERVAGGPVLTVHVGPGARVVCGVPSALRRVVSALVDNAIGHTPADGAIEVTVDAGARSTVVLAVRDTGVGFAPADAERLFERFARGSAGHGRRFGLGLALVRDVVEGHGGTVTAEGAVGVGAGFTVTLPAAARGTSVGQEEQHAGGQRGGQPDEVHPVEAADHRTYVGRR